MKAHEYWFSHYGVRRNPGIFFMSFYTSKNKNRLPAEIYLPASNFLSEKPVFCCLHFQTYGTCGGIWKICILHLKDIK